MAYKAPVVPALRASLLSEVIRDQFGLVATEFSLLPATLGPGAKGFEGGQWNNGTFNTPTIVGGTFGTTTKPVVVVAAFQIFNKTSIYPALTTGLVGFVRQIDGKLTLLDGSRVKLFTDDSHNLVMGSGVSEYAITDAGGLLYIPARATAATGTPTTYTGAVPMVFDRGLEKIGVFNGGAWKWVATALSGSATFDPPSLLDGAGQTTTVPVTGAVLGDFSEASFSLDVQGITVTAWVSAANTVSVRFQNETGATIDLASGTLRAQTRKA